MGGGIVIIPVLVVVEGGVEEICMIVVEVNVVEIAAVVVDELVIITAGEIGARATTGIVVVVVVPTDVEEAGAMATGEAAVANQHREGSTIEAAGAITEEGGEGIPLSGDEDLEGLHRRIMGKAIIII